MLNSFLTHFAAYNLQCLHRRYLTFLKEFSTLIIKLYLVWINENLQKYIFMSLSHLFYVNSLKESENSLTLYKLIFNKFNFCFPNIVSKHFFDSCSFPKLQRRRIYYWLSSRVSTCSTNSKKLLISFSVFPSNIMDLLFFILFIATSKVLF